jgi:hypothetical protein
MYSRPKNYIGTDIYNRNDFTDTSQVSNITVVDTSGASLNANDYVLKTGDYINGPLVLRNDSNIIFNDGSVQERALTNERITQLEETVGKLVSLTHLDGITKIEGGIELDEHVLIKANIAELDDDLDALSGRIGTNEGNITTLLTFKTNQLTYNNSTNNTLGSLQSQITTNMNDIDAIEVRVSNNETLLETHTTKLLEIDTIHDEITTIMGTDAEQSNDITTLK